MTLEEIKQLGHISVETLSEGLVKVTVDSGYQLKDSTGVVCSILYCNPLTNLSDYILEEVEEINTEDVVINPEEYENKVNDLIRQRYTLSEELALLRQQASKADEYKAYYDYCEECKVEAENILKVKAVTQNTKVTD